MPRSSSGTGSWAVDQAAGPPVGFVEVRILAPPAEAAQKVGEGQETS